MSYVITEPCVGTTDRSCVEVCPVDCIQPSDGASDAEQLYIDPAECIDCGACVSTCPVNAIFPDTEVPEHWEHFIEINAAFFREREGVSA
ncbi:4Fe-4S dicluster domain-containing protein [Nocardioides sp. YJ-D4]